MWKQLEKNGIVKDLQNESADSLADLGIDLPATPEAHFNLYFYAAVLHLIEHTERMCGSRNELFEQFPFLLGYWVELEHQGIGPPEQYGAMSGWYEAIDVWAAQVECHLPLKALREQTGLSHEALTLLIMLGMAEEDARFGVLFESLQGAPGQHRPTMGLVSSLGNMSPASGTARDDIRRLLSLGLAEVLNPDAPRGEWVLQAPPLVWDALRGEPPTPFTSWVRYYSPSELADLHDLVLSHDVRKALQAVPDLVFAGRLQALIVRGPNHNGRHASVGAVCRGMGRGLLELNGLKKGDPRWKLVGPLAILLNAVPLVAMDLGPEEAEELPPLPGYGGPIAVVLGTQGGVSGPGVERSITVTLPVPGPNDRRDHWQLACPHAESTVLDALGEGFRMTSGNIHRAAALAQSYAGIDGREGITLQDARLASRALNRQALDTIAAQVQVEGDWGWLAVTPDTERELLLLESRCRYRERMGSAVNRQLGIQVNAGVRALFSGPSGTGKTLAARVLASVLGMDLYRLDLSSVVNKYIGETEKNLNKAFARAEELDVILLLDEGDALLTQRTGVHNSNDRYANLETNYLLQRLESYEGILVVTTNASQRIDPAFQRRMDVVVNFHAPDVQERWAIWQMHLPEEHAIASTLLDELALQCALSGGQVRNAVLHAALLALADGGTITSGHIETAVYREYRKIGAVCPLRRAR